MANKDDRYQLLASDTRVYSGNDPVKGAVVWLAFVDPRYNEIVQRRADGMAQIGGEIKLWSDDTVYEEVVDGRIGELETQKEVDGFTVRFTGSVYYDTEEDICIVVDPDSNHFLNKQSNPASSPDKYYVDRSVIPDDLDFRK